MPDESHFQKLLALMVKLEQSKRHARLEIDFDGSKFKWTISFGGLSAEEWSPQKQLPPRRMVDG